MVLRRMSRDRPSVSFHVRAGLFKKWWTDFHNIIHYFEYTLRYLAESVSKLVYFFKLLHLYC